MSLVVPAGAGADADPPSDVLLGTDVYYPYDAVSGKLVRALDKTVARARAAGFPLKVALVTSRTDLGGVPGFFGRPQPYSEFLRVEISFGSKPRLLVVMPQGFGLAGAGPRSAVSSIQVESQGGSDALARAAMRAVVALARHAGHSFKPVPIPGDSGDHSRGTSTLLIFGGPVALLVLVAAAAALGRRRRRGDGLS